MPEIMGKYFAGFDAGLMADGFHSCPNGCVRRECAAIAEEMERSGCCAYFTGAFGFDRWMGAPDPLRRRILAEEHGVRTLRLDSDFWCENAMFVSTLERVDNLCVQL